MKHFRYKRTFLLFEVLLAMLIVSLCLIPLIRSPIQHYRNELKFLEEAEGERWAEWTFSEIKEKLLNHEISWDKIPKPGEASSPFPLPSIVIHLPSGSQKSIQRSFSLRCSKKGEKEDLSGAISRILWIDIFFNPKLSQKKTNHPGDYSFRLMVRALPPKKEYPL